MANNKTRIVLHIGQSKTGSSSLQAFLSSNRRILQSKGILYPDHTLGAVNVNLLNHNSLADSLSHRSIYPYIHAPKFFRSLETISDQEQFNTIILSAEHFFGGHPRPWDTTDEDQFFDAYRRKLERLRTLLPSSELTILLYLRNQLDWFRSSVCHLIKYQQALDNPNIYQNDRQYLTAIWPTLQYKKLLHTWSSVFGKKSMIVVPYDPDLIHCKDVISDFVERIGIDRNGLQFHVDQEDRNITWPPEFTEFKKTLNRIKRSKTNERFCIALLDEMASKATSSAQYTIDPAAESAIRTLAEADNTFINEHFMSNGMGLRLPKHVENTSVSYSDIESAFMELYRIRLRSLDIPKIYLKSVLRNHFPSLHIAFARLSKYLHKKQ